MFCLHQNETVAIGLLDSDVNRDPFPASAGRMACKQYEQLRREAAALRIQKKFRQYVARKAYLAIRLSATTLQAGLRAMIARNEFRMRKRTKAAIHIQVFSCSVSILFKISSLSIVIGHPAQNPRC